MRSQSIKSQVYESIRKDIMDGVYQANDILNEKTLVEKYQVSKSPVREALVQLCSEGMLKSIPRFGYQLPAISPGEIIKIIEFRKIIELAALEICFYQLTAQEIDTLKALNAASEKIIHTQSIREHWDSNQQFHRALCSFCGNPYLQKSLSDCLNICTRIANQYFTRLWNASKSSDGTNHIRLVQAIEEQNLTLAKEILSSDVEEFRHEIL